MTTPDFVCQPENPQKLACDTACGEECHEGVCEGFKIWPFDVTDANGTFVGGGGIRSGNEFAACNGGSGFTGLYETYGPTDGYIPTNIYFCGSPVSPVTITIGEKTTTIAKGASWEASGYQWYPPERNSYAPADPPIGFWSMQACCTAMQWCCHVDPVVSQEFTATDAKGHTVSIPQAIVVCID